MRELRFARGRFALLGTVIALMTLMVVLLTGLTAGLGAASISAVSALPVDHLAFQRPPDGQDVSFSSSSLPADIPGKLAGAPGVTTAYALGVSATRLRAGTRSAAVTLLGADPALHPAAAGEVAVTAALADELGLAPGDRIDIAGQPVTVASIVADTSFNHLPVIYTSIATWQRLTRTAEITAVGFQGGELTAIDAALGVSSVTKSNAYGAVGGYASEQGSLLMMRMLLLGVSVLIVGAFFTVWTMQRAGDLAVVRAIGAGRGYLLRDALAQAAVVLVAGAALGGVVAAGLGALAARVVPFVLDTGTVATPIGLMLAVGLLGAAVSVRRVSTVDPLVALGAAR